MDDTNIQDQIERLVAEEHELKSNSGDPERRERLEGIKIELDRCWDLLRQRRAREELGQDPDQVQARDAETVEHFPAVTAERAGGRSPRKRPCGSVA